MARQLNTYYKAAAVGYVTREHTGTVMWETASIIISLKYIRKASVTVPPRLRTLSVNTLPTFWKLSTNHE